MPDTLPPSVPTGSARAARTAGKKLEFARQYCSQCPVPIQLISRHARSLDATRKLRRILRVAGVDNEIGEGGGGRNVGGCVPPGQPTVARSPNASIAG